jgi:hypothetical protein
MDIIRLPFQHMVRYGIHLKGKESVPALTRLGLILLIPLWCLV